MSLAKAEPLTAGLLDHWLDVWRQQDIPLVNEWNPGLSADAIAACERGEDVRLPPELTTWFRWRDGIQESGPDAGRSWVAGTFTPLPLGVAIEETRRRQALLLDVMSIEPGLPNHWLVDEAWLVLGVLGHGGAICVELAHDGEGCSRVRREEPEATFEEVAFELPSLGILIRWWIEATENGGYVWDHSKNWWGEGDPDAIPEDRWSSGFL